MEEEIRMLFRASQQEGWRNQIMSINPVDHSPDFWAEIGLPSFSQLDFNLNSSLERDSLAVPSGYDRPLSSSPKPSAFQGFGQQTANTKSLESFSISSDSGNNNTFSQLPSSNFPVTQPNTLYLTNILRLTVDCPFQDIRKQAENVLFLLLEKGVRVPSIIHKGPSKFIFHADCPNINGELTSDEEDEDGEDGENDTLPVQNLVHDAYSEELIFLNAKRARLLSEAFLSSGRIDHTIQLMAYHPDYLEIFLRTHHFLLRGDGPLPYHYRNYIAIMAAARYQCSYLMELQKREFLFQGGDPKWLRGLESAPTKLTSLYNINKMMAHRPWVLKKEDFLHLTKKAGWSLSEVVQAVVLLAHFHSLSSFIHGCGITPEIDFDKGHTYLDPSTFNLFGSSTSSPIGGIMEEGLGMPGSGPQTPSPDAAKKLSLSESQLKKSSDLSSSVSFAADPTATFPPPSIFSNSSSDLTKGKPTKSILKKTDLGISSTPTANNHLNLKSSNSSPGSLNISSTSPTAPSSNLLKPATHQNLLSGPASPPKNKGFLSAVSEVDTIMATMKNLSETSPIEDPEERKKRFEKVASCDDTNEKENVMSATQTRVSSLPPEVSLFVCDPEFTYEDFAKRGHVAEMHTFRIQDYSWEEHGFSLVNRLYADVGGYIDEKFKVAQNMTYYTMGGRAHVDTTKFRTAVWNYIQCLYGIRHDDYDYGEVNQLLERPLKSYIKTVCCYPERVTKADYDNVMREFKHSEKVHVNLMIMEAKIQAELLYALRTIMRFIL